MQFLNELKKKKNIHLSQLKKKKKTKQIYKKSRANVFILLLYFHILRYQVHLKKKYIGKYN
jgi:hypothetical protein